MDSVASNITPTYITPKPFKPNPAHWDKWLVCMAVGTALVAVVASVAIAKFATNTMTSWDYNLKTQMIIGVVCLGVAGAGTTAYAIYLRTHPYTRAKDNEYESYQWLHMKPLITYLPLDHSMHAERIEQTSKVLTVLGNRLNSYQINRRENPIWLAIAASNDRILTDEDVKVDESRYHAIYKEQVSWLLHDIKELANLRNQCERCSIIQQRNH